MLPAMNAVSFVLLVLLGGALGCGGGDDGPPDFDVRPSVQQLMVWHAPASTMLVVEDGSGAEVAMATTDAMGSLSYALNVSAAMLAVGAILSAFQRPLPRTTA